MIDKANVWVMDLETYPNFFGAGFVNMETGVRLIFELSPRCDHADELWNFLYWCMQADQIFLGFNTLHFDYPIIHLFMNMCFNGQRPTAQDMYAKAQGIIDAPRNDWSHNVWESDHYIRQIDVFALMHFNRMGQGVSLKQLEVAMRSIHVEDLPHPPGVPLPPEMYDPMNWYMALDIDRTMAFANLIWDRIEFRAQMDDDGVFPHSCLNWNDVKIGTQFLLNRLKAKGVRLKDGKTKRQTPRHEGIRFADFLPRVDFDHPELQRVYEFFMGAHIKPEETKGFMTGLSATVGGLKMDFGTGGLHGAVPSTTWHSCSQRVIRLDDVVSYYPRLAVTQNYYPEHLTTAFVDEYDALFEERKKFPKGTLGNQSRKLSLNGSFGQSNSKFSELYDPQMMLAITVTGQLFLARLVEVLARVPTLQLIQCNTDGVTTCVDREYLPQVDAVCQWWMDWTGLELEDEYWSLWGQRDVNNYLAIMD